MSIQHAYNQWATSYDTDHNRTRDLDQQLMRELLQGQEYRSILELGCGTGKNTQFFSTLGAEVVALDFSAGMLEQARSKINASHVQFQQADLTQAWPVASGHFDLVVTNLVLEHLADLDHFFAQASQAMAAHGQLLISELHPFRQYQGSQARFQGQTGVIQVAAFTHHISDFLLAAAKAGLQLSQLHEHWHNDDLNLPPRLLTLRWHK
ncbi:class I SAM-dependent methyltransferase [Herpetosiphon llansteffanensis]